MKKVSYILAVLIGLMYLFISWAVFMAAQDATSEGRTISVGFLNLKSSVIGALMAITSLLAVIGSIGGLLSKPWAKKLALGGVIGIAVVQIYQGSILSVGIAVIALLIYLFDKK